MPSTQPHINIFIAYSREDVEYLKRLKTHLRPLERNYECLNIWYDGEIVPGKKWDEEIKKHVHNDEIIVLLISAKSLASDYFYDEEVKHALERHRKDETIVIPIIVKACLWQQTPVAELQALPQDGKPISQWNDEAQAYANIADGINKNIQIAIEKKQKKIDRLLTDTRVALDNKEFVKAKEYVVAIFKIEPNYGEAKKLGSEINEAEKIAKQIAELLEKAKKDFNVGNLLQAKEYIKNVLQLNPNHKEAEELRLEINQIIEKQNRIARLLVDSQKEFDNKNFIQAKKYVEEILKENPNHEEANELLSKINKEKEKQEEIEQLLADGYKALANKDFAKAEQCVEEIFKKDPNNEDAKKLQLEIKQEIDRGEKIVQLLGDTKKAFNARKFEQAQKYVDEILQLDSNHKKAKEFRLEINQEIEKRDKITQLYKDAKEAFNAGKFIQSKEYVDEILQSDPNHKGAKELLPKINKAVEKQEETKQLLKKGYKYLANKEFVKAEECVEEIFKKDPNNEDAKKLDSEIEKGRKIAEHLQNAYESLNRNDYRQAIIHAKSVLKLDPNHQEAKEIIRQCKKEQRGVIFEDLKNPFLIAALVATLVNIYLVYKVLQKHHQEYQSKCVSGNCKNGEGRLEYEDGRVYDGEWKDGKFHGQGIFIYQSDTIYDGQWKNNIMNGDGIRYYENGAVYDGNWINGIREGKGKFTIPDIGEYNGAFENDMFNGDGIFIYLDGTIYDGQWRNNRKHGQE